jgi:2-haloacid dehalogenase
MPNLKQFKVIAFDTMGTLLDERKGVAQATDTFFSKLSPGTTQEELYDAFSSAIEHLLSTETPSTTTYASLLERSIIQAYSQLSSGTYSLTSSEASAFAEALRDWPPFPDTVSSLQFLASKGYKLVLLSNMDTQTLRLIADKHTGSLGDVPLAALRGRDITGAFKPDHKVINGLLDAASKDFGATKDEVLMVAQGLSSDHVPAFELGVASAWIDRYGQGKDAIPQNARPKWVTSNLEELCMQVKEDFKDEIE